ncbi:hypothetical protein GCM10007049_10650 [Echinicola pacifica]|uniref:Pentapeptide repeat-containing protein n=1 Tax=Echinicola pacifica TaxID=346377 RepID=A0A918UM72_9BACT|nr:pentapeptide repeat-containing protein [Echinicola pacifica]GGZ19973.1 hypothetical protein GCM10007049_10650 [Echinicola pacifica]
MNSTYFEDQSFDQNLCAIPFPIGDYDGCTFTKCNLSNEDLRNCKFIDCSFTDCDLSNAQIQYASFQGVTFKNCKLFGMHFHKCDPLLITLSFEDCQLDYSSFFKLKMQKTPFLNCRLRQVDFSNANLMGSDFSKSDCTDTVFDQTNLIQCNFQSAENFSISPDKNQIKKAKFSQHNLVGLLHGFGIVIR